MTKIMPSPLPSERYGAEMNSPDEKVNFIKKHAPEIEPILSGPEAETFKTLRREDYEISSLEPEKIDALLEKFETKLFILEKEGSSEQAKRVLITMNDGGAYTAALPIVEALEKDLRCRGIGILASGIAEERFRKNPISEKFKSPANSDQKQILQTVLEMAEKSPFDIGIGTVTSTNGPESLALFAGKSSLGVRKLYFILEGWAELGGSFSAKGKNFDQLDGIFCNDDLAKKVVAKALPNFPDSKIFTTGTGQIDSLELDKTDQYREDTRKNLEISPDAIAVLYLGGVSSLTWEQYKVDEKIEEKTFSQTLGAVSDAARKNPEKKYVVLFRTHPADPNKEEYAEIATKADLPANMRCVKANSPLSINEAASAADMVCSTCSTESFKAHFRGQNGIFMAFDEPGMGYDLLRAVSGDTIMRAIEETNDMLIVRSPGQFSDFLSGFERKNSNISAQPVNSTQSILDIVFS